MHCYAVLPYPRKNWENSMNKIITANDLRELGFKNLWELKNPKFSQAPKDSKDSLIQFKLRHSGSPLSFLTNYLTPSRLYGFRKFFAVLLWLFIIFISFGTVTAFRTGSGDMGQVYFTLFFIGLYLLLFVKSGASRLRRWEVVYTKAVKTDLDTHTQPIIIFDGQDMLLANKRIFELIGDRPINVFVEDSQSQFQHKERQELQAKKAAEKEKARFKKEKEDQEFKEAVAEIGPLIGSGIKSLISEGGVASRAAQSARGTLKKDSLSSRAAKAARGTATSSSGESNAGAPSNAGSVKIEGFTGSYWETCATGLENNANYIAARMQQIRKSNSRYTKLRAVDSNGRIIDVG